MVSPEEIERMVLECYPVTHEERKCLDIKKFMEKVREDYKKKLIARESATETSVQ